MPGDHIPDATIDQVVTQIHRHRSEEHTPALLNLLRTVGDDGATPAELADQLDLSRATVNRVIRDLTVQGLLEQIHHRVRLTSDAGHTPEGTETPMPTDEGTTLHTETDAQTDAEADGDTRPADKPDWPWWATAALEQIRTATAKVRRFVEADPAGVATLAGTVVLSVVAILVVVSLGARFLEWLTTGDPVDNLSGAVPASRIAIDPIEHWLTAHTAGLPLTVSTAAWTWAVAGLLLLAASIFRHVGAQLLWVAYGAATASMAWFGTPVAAHRPIAAGLVAVAWVALSLLVIPGPGRPRPSRVIRIVRTDEEAAA